MQTSSPRHRDPAAIFENMGQASAPPTAQQAMTPRAHTEVVRATNGGELVTDDPNTIVEAVVRPHHNYGGMPPGSVIKLPFREYEAHQAALCSRGEYQRITAIQSSPEHQALQRKLADMRAATTDAFLRSLTPDKRAQLEQARQQAAADDQREDVLRREIAQAAQASRPQPAPAPILPPAVPETAEALEALIAQRRAATEQAAAGATPRGKERMRALMDEEELELRQAFVAAQAERQAAAARAQQLREMAPPPGAMLAQEGPGRGFYDASNHHAPAPAAVVVQASPEERLKKLAGLFAEGLLTAEVYQQRQAEIAREL